MSREEAIRSLSTEELQAFLERELGDGVPTDWGEWLREEAG